MPRTAGLFILFSFCFVMQALASDLTDQDKKSIQSLLEHYRTAWLANNEEDVMSIFSQDAVLMPHHGDEPVIGEQAIRTYWWPAGVKYTIDQFTNTVDAIEGTSEYACARGKSNVTWTTYNGSSKTTQQLAGTYIMVVKKMNGAWKVTLHMWDDPQPH